jgi:hypothetical protein
MNKFIFQVLDRTGLTFGHLNARAGSECRASLDKTHTLPKQQNFMGVTTAEVETRKNLVNVFEDMLLVSGWTRVKPPTRKQINDEEELGENDYYVIETKLGDRTHYEFHAEFGSVTICSKMGLIGMG